MGDHGARTSWESQLNDTISNLDQTTLKHTVRAKKSNRGPLTTDLFPGPSDPSTSPRKAPVLASASTSRDDDDFEDGFDLPGQLHLNPAKFHLLGPSTDALADPTLLADGQSISTRSRSRLSNSSSVFSSAESSGFGESETDDELVSGLEIPSQALDLRRALEVRQLQRQQEAQQESELYGTMHKRQQTHPRPEAFEEEPDLLDGLELDEHSFRISQQVNTMHRNVRKEKGRPMTQQPQQQHRKLSRAQSQATLTRPPMKSSASMAAMRVASRGQLLSKASMPALVQLAVPKNRQPSYMDDRSGGGKQGSPHRVRSSQLRPVQSMANVAGHSTISTPSSRRKPPVRPQQFDGDELDAMDDLDINRTLTSTTRLMPKVNFEDYAERPSNHARKMRSTQRRQVPRLIQQTTVTPAETGYDGQTLFYNAESHVWEGNEADLRWFNHEVPAKLSLIPSKGGFAPQVVGNMVFDSDKLAWVNMAEDDNDDPFAGISDLQVSVASSSARVGQQSRVGSVVSGEFVVGKEFELSRDFIAKLEHEDSRWERKTKGWFGDLLDREYLMELRRIVESN